MREYWALLEGVTMWDVGVERQIEISGPDEPFRAIIEPFCSHWVKQTAR